MMIYPDPIKNGARQIWNLKFSTMPVINTDDQPNICAGCSGKIVDRYYLLAVDKQWHVQCLKCCECKLRLDSELTCFAKDGSIYCKEDYYRRFSVKRCARCHLGISANELVMRAKDAVYHLHCFTCASCNKALTTGDHFGMKENIIYCRIHYELSLQGDYMPHLQQNSTGMPGSHALSAAGLPYYNGVGAVHKGRPRKRKSPAPDSDVCPQNIGLSHGDTDSDLDRDPSTGYATSPQAPNSGNNGQTPRTKRMRTSFKHHQLRAMRSYFALNHNPDAKDLKQLAQKTGLTKRVLQVWFQNARAKFRRNLLKQDGQGPEKAAETTSLEDLHNSSSQPMTRDLSQSLSEMHNANVADDEQSVHALSDLF